MLNLRRGSLGVLLLLLGSCSRTNTPVVATPPPDPWAPVYGDHPGNFRDDVQTNASVEPDLSAFTFLDTAGNRVELQAYRGTKNIVLIFTRGYPGYVCPNCSTLTSRLIANYEEFRKRDAEIFVVFPGDRSRIDEFLTQARPRDQTTGEPALVPFPVLLDENLQVVDKLRLRASLAKPSTFILDKAGKLRFAYVGATSADRPSIKAMLEQLDLIANPHEA